MNIENNVSVAHLKDGRFIKLNSIEALSFVTIVETYIPCFLGGYFKFS